MLLLYLGQPEYAAIPDEDTYYYPQESGQIIAAQYVASATNRYEFRATERDTSLIYRTEPTRR